MLPEMGIGSVVPVDSARLDVSGGRGNWWTFGDCHTRWILMRGSGYEIANLQTVEVDPLRVTGRVGGDASGRSCRGLI